LGFYLTQNTPSTGSDPEGTPKKNRWVIPSAMFLQAGCRSCMSPNQQQNHKMRTAVVKSRNLITVSSPQSCHRFAAQQAQRRSTSRGWTGSHLQPPTWHLLAVLPVQPVDTAAMGRRHQSISALPKVCVGNGTPESLIRCLQLRFDFDSTVIRLLIKGH